MFKTSYFTFTKIKCLKNSLKINHTSRVLISVYSKLQTQTDQNVNNKNDNTTNNNENKNTNQFVDDWFKKLTDKSSSKLKNDSQNTKTPLASSKINFETMSKDDKRNLIIDIWELEKERGQRPMPKVLGESDLEYLCKTVSIRSQIVPTLSHLVKEHYYREEKQRRKEMILKRKEENEKKREADKSFITNYWGHQTFMRRIGTQNERSFLRAKMLSSIINDAPKVVYDFRYESKINSHAVQKSLYRQMAEVINTNRTFSEPFQLYLCNFSEDGWFKKEFAPNLALDSNMIFETTKSYTDLFPKEKLVYLSKDATTTMKYFDPNKIYIIGAIIDRGPNDFLYASYGQAKQDQVECQRLPLDQYVKFSGGKNLNLDSVLKILLNLYHNDSNWDKAFRESLPKRKVGAFNSDLTKNEYDNTPVSLFSNKKRNFKN